MVRMQAINAKLRGKLKKAARVFELEAGSLLGTLNDADWATLNSFRWGDWDWPDPVIVELLEAMFRCLKLREDADFLTLEEEQEAASILSWAETLKLRHRLQFRRMGW